MLSFSIRAAWFLDCSCNCYELPSRTSETMSISVLSADDLKTVAPYDLAPQYICWRSDGLKSSTCVLSTLPLNSLQEVMVNELIISDP